MTHYNNAVLSLTKTGTPDPHVTYGSNKFYLTFTAGDRVEIWNAKSLSNFYDHPEKTVIWRPPPDTEYSNDLWAPELHQLQGRWYVYFAACHPHHGNKSHRMYILGGPPSSQDPTRGSWEFLGPIRGMDQSQWAIDGTVIELAGQLYFVYSGWPFENPNESDLIQQLFIVQLADPLTARSKPVEICRPDEPFERTGDHGINEGPQYLASRNGSWTGLVYSCAGSWTKEYKMNTLQFVGGDPLDPQSWQKGSKPLLKNGNHDRGPWGPGHGSFVHIGDEVVGIYHATDSPGDGWNNRKARMQRVIFRSEGPFMGEGVGPLTTSLEVFLTNGAAHDQSGHKERSGPRALIKKLRDELYTGRGQIPKNLVK
ncbi:hypothetical protein MBLNU459_g3238t1 [Dothideomycetes sp. NU459]